MLVDSVIDSNTTAGNHSRFTVETQVFKFLNSITFFK